MYVSPHRKGKLYCANANLYSGGFRRTSVTFNILSKHRFKVTQGPFFPPFLLWKYWGVLSFSVVQAPVSVNTSFCGKV